MGLLDEICEKRSKLTHTCTVVTTAGGKVFKEEKSVNGSVTCEPVTSESECRPGFVVDLKPDLDLAEVLPGLCLGSQDITQDAVILQKHAVTDIVSLGVDVPHLETLKIDYHFIPVLDLPETDLNAVLDKVLPLIHELLSKDRIIFVHCNAGVSRSPSVVIAYLMEHHSMSFDDAFQLVKSKRPAVKPNEGFIKQLISLDSCSHIVK